MALGPKTEAFFKRLQQQAEESPVEALESIPLTKLRCDNQTAFVEWAGELPDGVVASDFVNSKIVIDTEGTKVSLVTYTPPDYDAVVDSTAVFFYGGGFVIPLLAAHFPGIARFANQARCKVIAVDYPVAPECTAKILPGLAFNTVVYLFKNCKQFAINPVKFNILGYSSGGNLAAGVAYQNILQDNIINIDKLILMNPWLDLTFKLHKDNPYLADQDLDKMATTEALEYFALLYLKDVDPAAPLVSPILIPKKVLSKFPTTHILSSEYDRLRGTVKYFADRLVKADVAVFEKVFAGQTHNLFIARGVMGDGEDPASYLSKVLGQPAVAPFSRL